MSHLREGLGDEQIAFMPGRGTADAIFAVRQRMKRERKVQHYKHIVIKYSHVRLKITTRYLTISQRKSLCLRLSHV